MRPESLCRPATYMTESAAWGALPWDLRSLALYHLGRTADAVRAVDQAIALCPGDERLQKNRLLMEAAGEGRKMESRKMGRADRL